MNLNQSRVFQRRGSLFRLFWLSLGIIAHAKTHSIKHRRTGCPATPRKMYEKIYVFFPCDQFVHVFKALKILLYIIRNHSTICVCVQCTMFAQCIIIIIRRRVYIDRHIQRCTLYIYFPNYCQKKSITMPRNARNNLVITFIFPRCLQVNKN